MALNLAIEKAASIEGSQRALAKRLGIRENYLSDMKHGLKPCTVANRVKIAQIAGVDPKRAAVEGLIDQLDDNDEIQKGAKAMLQSMLDAFPKERNESKNPEQEGQQGMAERSRQ
ncbi:MAG: helix-turn-helix transcriptional regulator [Acidovorax sp.]|uniref:helix-turn-helix transcriptional regulator n=1 Tax=Acidovorax sp. TaxID=1872122 RepID=UPI00263A1D00|nr:helix-turn-helix transcriptional regulator [Acidovorax sp.]MDH4464474.1 helix-turn-helix transcriptional regulator [Acidovorax sp.]